MTHLLPPLPEPTRRESLWGVITNDPRFRKSTTALYGGFLAALATEFANGLTWPGSVGRAAVAGAGLALAVWRVPNARKPKHRED